MLQQTAYRGEYALLRAYLQERGRVPSLVKAHHETLLANLLAGTFENSIFGAYQFLAWNYSSPSRPEQILWRVSSLATLCLPCTIIVVFAYLWKRHHFIFDTKVLLDSMMHPYLSVAALFVPLYGLARLYIMVEVFAALRSCPIGACDTVRWTEYIPGWT